MRNLYNNQLMQLNGQLIAMGALCEDAIRNASQYLTVKSKEAKENVYTIDRQIDQMEREIETLCTNLILHQQPVAKDLRTISSALNIVPNMERIGDQAYDIVDILENVNISELEELETKIHISDMAEATIKMVQCSIDSFVKKDVNTALNVIEYDNVIDDMFDNVKNELIKSISEKNDDAEALIDLLMIAKYFERIGDHAENIAEWVIYSITGEHKNID